MKNNHFHHTTPTDRIADIIGTTLHQELQKARQEILSTIAQAIEENTAFYEQKYGGNYEQCGRDIKFSIAQDLEKKKSNYELLGNRTVEEYCEHIKTLTSDQSELDQPIS